MNTAVDTAQEYMRYFVEIALKDAAYYYNS